MTPPSGRWRATKIAGSAPLASGKACALNDMRAPVDRYRGHRRHVTEEFGPVGVEQSDIVEAANVPGEPQLQRLAERVLAVHGALGSLVDEDGPDPLHVCAGNLKIDEPEGCGGRHGNRKTEREREAKSPSFEDLSRQHSV